jgi:protein phosphatase
MFNVVFLTDVGLKRTLNEDAILVDKEKATFIVADGMGGHEKGEVASQLLIETFRIPPMMPIQTLPRDDDSTVVPSLGIEKELNFYIETTTNKIIAYAEEKKISGTMGTTVVGLKYLENIQAWVLFHLGDSRAYLYHDSSLRQLTTDHSKHESMRSNHISEEEIQKMGKNVITKAVGNFKPYTLDIEYITPQDSDILLLCSDGVSDLCTKDELLLLIIQYKNNLDFLCTQIKKLIYARGAKDNLSIIAIEITKKAMYA